ncbi:hypothetical protein M885DRAFT_469458, partial [Pelagophyceae sp. CCMP2097]
MKSAPTGRLVRHYRVSAPGKMEKTFFVRNIPRDATVDDVRRAFSNSGFVVDCRVPTHDAGQARGYAFVTLATLEADAVISELDNTVIFGKDGSRERMRVQLADPLKNNNDNARAAAPAAAEDNAVLVSLAINRQLLRCANASAALTLFRKRGSDFNEVNFATAMHQVGFHHKTITLDSKPLVDALVLRATASIANDYADRWAPRGLANAAWAAARIGDPAPALFAAVAGEALLKMGDFNSQAMASMLWAFATAHEPSPLLFAAAAAAMPRIVSTFTTQQLANVVWAYARAGAPAPLLFEAVEKASLRQLQAFNSQELANVVWSYAKMEVKAHALFNAVAVECGKKIESFTSQALANTVWAFAKAGVAAPSLFEAVAVEAPKSVATWTPKALSNTVWAFATAGVAAPQLFQAVAKEARRKIKFFKPQNVANTAWAFATSGIAAPQLFHAFAASAD